MYGDPIEINLNSILLIKQRKLVGELSFLSVFYAESAYFINCLLESETHSTLFSIITSFQELKAWKLHSLDSLVSRDPVYALQM